MIRIYTRGSYDPAIRKGLWSFYLFSDASGRRYKESGPYECDNSFVVECEAIFKGLSWVVANRDMGESAEVICSPIVFMYLNLSTSKYFKPRSANEMSAVGTIMQLIAQAGLSISYSQLRAGDDSTLELMNEKIESGACH